MKIILLFLVILMPAITIAQEVPEESLALQYFQAGEFGKAVVIYEKLYEATKNSAYYDFYFTCLLKVKQYDRAEDLVKQLMRSNSNNYIYPVDLGRVYRERGEQAKSDDLYNRLIRELPANDFVIKDLAITLYRAEAYEFSIKALLNGRKLVNDETAFSYDLLSLYRYRKNKPMLIQEYLVILDKNPGILNQAQNVLANIFENQEDYDLLRSALIKRLQKDPQNVVLTEFLIWQYVQQKDFDMAVRQTLALDRRLREDGSRVFELSNLLISNLAYDQAVEALNYLVAKGKESKYYIPAKIDLLNVKTKQLTANRPSQSTLQALESAYLSLLGELGHNAATSFAIRQLAQLQAFYLHKAEEAALQLASMIRISSIPPIIIGQAKLELADVYILTGDLWEAALLYGQVEKQFANEPYGQDAKFRNAKLSYFQGEFIWSKAQLDVLKSSTSQLIANDALNLSLMISDNLQREQDTSALKVYASADLLIFKNEPDKALAVLDSIGILYPDNSLEDDILMARSKIFLKQGDFSKAEIHLKSLANQYSTGLWGDDAVFMLAELYETKLNDPEKAIALYQRIITEFPGSLYVAEARKRFRQLRGDKLS